MTDTEITDTEQPGSASLEQGGYWWYRARTQLLRAGLASYLGSPRRLLDVGSADGPSVGWLSADRRFQVDVDPRGLVPGSGVRASALRLPFRDATFDVVGAFDVLEHCEPEHQALSEFSRVLVPGGLLLLSVPAYQWAWSDHDVRAGHHRRYTRRRLVHAVRREGFVVHRSSYAFAAVFPFFVAERAARRLRPGRGQPVRRLPSVPAPAERLLLGLCDAEQRILQRRNLPFGSSVLLAAEKPA